MKVALIPPTPHLLEFACYKKNNYHMALAQRVLDDSIYAKFYKSRSEQNEIVILDNGACELEESIGFDELLRAISLVNPSIVVLPDKLGDFKKTLELSINFLNIKNKISKSITFMGVVQGQNKEEWMECFKLFSHNPQISIIGISKTNAFFKDSDNQFGRYKTIEYLNNNKLIPKNKKIHLLGLGNSSHTELKLMNKFDFIEGVDSSAPIVHGYLGIKFIPEEPYKKVSFSIPYDSVIPKEKKDLIFQNIDVLYKSLNK